MPRNDAPDDVVAPLLIAKRAAARMLGISASMVDVLLRRGELRGVKIGRRRLFTLAELEALIERKGAVHE